MNPSEIGLKNKTAVLKAAKAVAKHHLGQEVKSAKECALQGMFSRTVIVRMKSQEEYVVQLRAETVHEANSQQAHKLLGDVVPLLVRVSLEDTPVPYAYIMPFAFPVRPGIERIGCPRHCWSIMRRWLHRLAI
jgi:hypothetical protein